MAACFELVWYQCNSRDNIGSPQNYAGLYVPNKHHKAWQVTGLGVR